MILQFLIILNFRHRDERIYPKPDQFDPDRWLRADAEKLLEMEGSFLPFGQGSRICPGMNLANYEAVLAIAFLCYHFDLALDCPPEEIHRIFSFVAEPNKAPIRLTSLR